MADKKELAPAFGIRLGLCMLGVSLVALVVYSLTLAGYVFPGESARLCTQWMGMDALDAPKGPIWGSVVKAVGGLSFPANVAVRINLVSLVCGVLSAGLVCGLVGFFVRCTVRQEDTVRLVDGASVVAGLAAGLACVFSSAVWQTATHLEYRIFDVCFALLLFALFVPMLRWPKALPACVALLGAGVGVGLVEGVVFVPLLPLYLLCVVVAAVKTGRKFYLPVGLFLVFSAVAYLVVANRVAGAYLALPEAAAGGFKGIGDVLVDALQGYAREMRQWVTRPGWLFLFVLAVVPFVACAFAAPRGLNNERTWSQYLFHAAMTVCVILAFATPLAPESQMRALGIPPVLTSVLVAVTAGYLAAYWYLLARAPAPSAEDTKARPEAAVGRRMAPALLGVFLGVLALAALVNAFGASRDRGAYADICANEIMDRMGARTWLVTDGLLDDHLRFAAASSGKELNLVCLQRDMDDAYLKELSALVRAKGLKAGDANLALSIELGVLPFLQDWFSGDPKISEQAAIFGVPDFWYMAERQPVPECLFFGGVRDVKKDVDGGKALAAFKAFWAKMEPVLHAERRTGSRAISKAEDPVDALRLQLRRHVGFVANNLGVVLQDLGRDQDAFELYELVLRTIDCDNICALFNEFEMARAGVPAAVARKAEIEKQLKAIVDDPKRRYMLWSLSRYYGYIRSPEIFARMGYAWARSGQTGNAIAQVQRAIDFVPADRQAGLLNMMAAIYASGNQAQKSREVYNKVLADDATNHDALMGLTRLALQKGAVAEAKGHLTKAVKAAKSPESSGFDWALLHLMNNDLSAARLSLQKVTDLQPKSLQAWSLLAGVLLQQFDTAKDAPARKKILEELDGIILPKMESIADSPRDYFVQMTRALVLMRKGRDHQKAARDALVAASAARPDATVVGDMILNLDIAMDDGESAEKHARQVLRQDRRNKLANYVMGSLRLKEGDYMTAETFLRLSVEQDQPLAAAQNDLAEVLRRLQRPAEAETFARAAVKTAPDLYVAWETLGSALLDQNKDLDDAESYVKKAIDLCKKETKGSDIRMQITLARVQIAKGDLGRARATLRTIRSHQDELSKFDLGEVEKLQKAMTAKGK